MWVEADALEINATLKILGLYTQSKCFPLEITNLSAHPSIPKTSLHGKLTLKFCGSNFSRNVSCTPISSPDTSATLFL